MERRIAEASPIRCCETCIAIELQNISRRIEWEEILELFDLLEPFHDRCSHSKFRHGIFAGRSTRCRLVHWEIREDSNLAHAELNHSCV